MTFNSEARLKIEIAKGTEQLQKIAIVPFNSNINSQYEYQVRNLINEKLTLFGEFESLDLSQMLSFPFNEANFFVRDWELLSIDYVIFGEITETDESLEINYVVSDINLKRIMLRGDISGLKKDIELIVKKISDRVYESITGLKGIFNTKLAYILNPEPDNYSICISDIDGNNEEVLFSSNSPLMSPDWSPDGKKLAYVSFEKGFAEIYIQNLLTGVRETIPTLGMSKSAPVWSPDSKSIAFVISMSGNPDLYNYNLKTKKISRLTSHYGIDTEPAWSPDSKKLLFTSNRSGSPQIFEIKLSNKRIKRVTLEGSYNSRSRFFPDGRNIVFVHGNNGVFHIATRNLKERFINIVTETKLDESPTISPNGHIIIYSAKKDDQGYLAGITLDSNDADNTKGVSGLASVSFASDGFTFTIGDVDLVGDSTGEVGNVASAAVDNGGYTATGIATGVADTEGYGFTASTSVGSASVSIAYLLDTKNEGVNNAESAANEYGTGLSISMPMGPLTLGLGYANIDGTADETTNGVTLAYAVAGGRLTLGYESTDESTDSTTMAAAFTGSLDADTSYSIGYTDGEQGTAASTQLEAVVSRSLGGGVSVYAEIQENGGTGTSGTNMSFGTTVAF